jgi:hypothetical protein
MPTEYGRRAKVTKWIVRISGSAVRLRRTVFHVDALVARALGAWPHPEISERECFVGVEDHGWLRVGN